MIDEADEFVAGPQNKFKRPGEANTPASLKRRRSMSPLLLRRPPTPPIITNHVGGKGPSTAPGSQTPHNIIKPIPIHKGKPPLFVVDLRIVFLDVFLFLW